MSPQWTLGSLGRRSPGPGNASSAGGFQHSPLQTPPYPERPMPGLNPFSFPNAHDRPARGHSIAGLPSASLAASLPTTSVSSSFFPDQRRGRLSESIASGAQRGAARPDLPMNYQTRSSPPPSLTNRSSSMVAGDPRQPIQPPLPSDALGPSIWTGTHFLPRFIDGEPVNAHWGVTKAGKPRKRLAVACLTCREKKIKCDPDFPKCVQCERFGRVCKFKNAPRGHASGSESYSFEEGEAPVTNPRASIYSTIEPTSGVLQVPDASMSEAAASPHRPASGRRRQSSPISDVDPLDASRPNENPRKRKQSSPEATNYWQKRPSISIDSGRAGRASVPDDTFRSGILAQPSQFHWQVDPYKVDPQLTTHLLDLYMRHVNRAVYCLFPPRPFMHWLESDTNKSSDDLMLIYTALTLASNFSGRGDRRTFSKVFARICRYAIDNSSGKHSLQLAQSRLLLALHFIAINKPVDAWDMGGSAARTAIGLKLHLEDDGSDHASDGSPTFGFNQPASQECRRRTFWSTYMMDRYHSTCSGQVCALNDEDIFIRLPCDDAAYERQADVYNPFFEDFLTDRMPTESSQVSMLGPLAYLIEICSIWGHVLTNVHRFKHRSRYLYGEKYESFYQATQVRLEKWLGSLPDYLTFSWKHWDVAMQQGNAAIFLSMHALYQTTHIKLNRHVIGRLIRSEHTAHNVCKAHRHAQELLAMMQTLFPPEAGVPAAASQHLTPFIAYAITLAAEIVTAHGWTSELAEILQLLDSGLAVVEEIKSNWSSARTHKTRISNRIADMQRLAQDQAKVHRGLTVDHGSMTSHDTFSMERLISEEVPSEDDLIYTTPTEVVMRALYGERKGSQASTTVLISSMSLEGL
ncbi:MAG: hypothetical protein M1817_000758 [Caeruleum heppii]|nr:MAG: hypothetical protein M1817_000758 [Caeruleum heppii]